MDYDVPEPAPIYREGAWVPWREFVATLDKTARFLVPLKGKVRGA